MGTERKPRSRRRRWIVAAVVLLAAVGAVVLATGGRGHRATRTLVRHYYAVIGDTGGPLTVTDRGSWTELEPGLELHTIDVTRPRNLSGVTLVAVRLDPAHYEFRVVSSPSHPERVEQAGPRLGAAAMIDGGYFDARGRPLGLLIADGVTAGGQLATAEGRAVFGVRDGVPFVSDAAGLELDGVTEALQTTPALVRGGVEVEGFDEPWRVDRRAGVCVDGEGRVVFAVTDTVLNGLSFSELAHLMARSVDRGGLGCEHAMALDGGTSAQLWTAGHEQASVEGFADVPVFLAAIPRSGP